jgi:hypothetical protein
MREVDSHRRRTALDEAASKLQFATARLRTLDQLTKKPGRRASRASAAASSQSTSK